MKSLIAIGIACVGGATAGAAAPPPVPADVLYAALHGQAEVVDPDVLVGAPGRFVGRAVKTRGALVAADASDTPFALVVGRTRVLLRLEPEARALVAARSQAWAGRPVTVEGLFYREAGGDAAGSPYALRAWRVWPVEDPSPPAETRTGDIVSLQDLVYAAGRYDGRVIRVRGTYRGSNRHADLPERTRKGRADWVIKDGYFAAWVTGREARGATWDLGQRSSSDRDAVVEVVGVPTTSRGVVRILARQVELSLAFVGGAIAQPRDAGLQAVSPRVSFAWPIPGETLRRRGHMVLQFSKPLDPQSLADRLRVRYDGAAAASPPAYEYHQRYRALVITPEAPPPPGAEVMVELLDGIIDIDGRALSPRDAAGGLGEGVADAVRFRSGR